MTIHATRVQIISVAITAMALIVFPLIGWGFSQNKVNAVQDEKIGTIQQQVDEVKQDIKEAKQDIKEVKTIALQILMKQNGSK